MFTMFAVLTNMVDLDASADHGLADVGFVGEFNLAREFAEKHFDHTVRLVRAAGQLAVGDKVYFSRARAECWK